MKKKSKEAKITIYVVGYKAFPTNKLPNFYKPIFVRSFRTSPNDLTDDTGDNISFKNADYCECTALYWIWKNDVNSEIVGMDQYRRYLVSFKKSIFHFHLLDKNEIAQILRHHDIIVPNFYNNRSSLLDERHTGSGNIALIRSIISDKTPEYLSAFDFYFGQSNTIFNNLFISRKDVITKYWEWVFPLFAEFEKRSHLDGKLIFGYLSERLLNVWILKNNLRIFVAPVYFAEGKDNFTSVFHAKARVMLARRWGKKPSPFYKNR
jgi:hypothetical protein